MIKRPVNSGLFFLSDSKLSGAVFYVCFFLLSIYLLIILLIFKSYHLQIAGIMMSGNEDIRQIRAFIRGNLNKYTRKAFEFLPKINKPRILDIGCGGGVPTTELANLSDGKIIALDNDPEEPVYTSPHF